MRLIDADSFSEKICEECHRQYVAPHEIDRMIAEQPTVPTFGQWIPASNPPENCEDVIVCLSGRRGSIFYDHGVETCDCVYEDGEWYVCGFSAAHLTIHAWMPLPEPPKRGGTIDD